MAELDAASGSDRRTGEAHRLLARAAADLSYTSVSELSDDLGTRLAELERVCGAAHEAVTSRYFRASAPIEWSA